jgi:CRP-like cAMP-binding protein
MKEFLKKIAIFKNLDDVELDFLARFAVQKEYSKDSYIIREDEPGISLFIVRSGAVDVILEQRGGTPISLNTIKSGEFFGEVSLFDGKPRSATVIAKENTTIIEITREILLSQISKYPDIALKILGKMSQRLRRSDKIVKDFSDRVYANVSKKIEEKLNVQIDHVETLYKATEERAAKTLDGVETDWKRLWRLICIIIGVFTFFASVITFLGYGKYSEIKKVSEMAEKQKTNINEVEKYALEVKKYALETEILQDVMLDIQKIREETKIDLLDIPQYKPTGDTLKYIAVNFLLGERELLENYINKCQDEDSEVCLAAVRTYMEIKQKGDIELDNNEIKKILSALIEVIRKSPKRDWRTQLRARDGVISLIEKTKEYDTKDYYYTIKQLKYFAGDKRLENHARYNYALILAHFHEYDDDAKMILKWYYKQSASNWQKNMAAIGLLQMDDKKIWYDITKSIYTDDDEGFVIAILLGQLGKEELSSIGVKELKNNSEIESINLINRKIKDGQDSFYSNKFMKGYCDFVIKGLG